jgi:hypothetical protein
MPRTTCNHCGAPCLITEADRDAGAEVYCSEACAAAKAGDPVPPRPDANDDGETVEPGDAHYYRGPGADR